MLQLIPLQPTLGEKPTGCGQPRFGLRLDEAQGPADWWVPERAGAEGGSLSSSKAADGKGLIVCVHPASCSAGFAPQAQGWR